MPYLRRAGQRAAARGVFAQAAAYFEEALTALAHLPATRETEELTVDLMLDLRDVLAILGELDRLLDCAGRALTLAEALGDRGRLGRALGSMTNALTITGDAAGAVAQGERALALVETTTDRAPQITTRWRLAQALYIVGDSRRAIQLLERNVEALGGEETYLTPLGLVLSGVLTRTWLALYLSQAGELDRATTVAEEGARAGVALDTAYNRLAVWFGLAVPRVVRGDHVGAIPVLERGLAVAREMNMPAWLPSFAGLLGYAHALAGHVMEGLALLDEAVRQAERSMRCGRGWWLSLLSEVYLLAGRPGDAVAAARRGLDGARQRHERIDEPGLLRALAEATAQTDPPDFAMADSLCREALALATELGMRPLVAHCHAGLARLYRRTGQREQAREHLTIATTMYREMDMRFWLEQVERELRGA